MKKFEGILICTDLDGTLLRNDKTISEENKRAIEYFKSEGGKFTFITGRMHYFATKMYDAIKPNAPIGCANGGAVYDFDTGRYVWALTVGYDVLELADYVCENIKDMAYQITMLDKIYFHGTNDEMDSFVERTGVERFTHTDEYIEEPIAKIVFCHPDPEMVIKALKVLKDHPRYAEFDYILSEKTISEILPKGACKGAALPRIAETVGVDMSRVIAIGDYYNDVTMLKTAALGIAVGNAVDDVKAVADRVTVTNEEHAIARVIADIESGEIKI